MVRKRQRKFYDQDDNDTDSDFTVDDPPAQPAQKKYSLRQRKRKVFTDDFEEEDEPVAPIKPPSDDDFEPEHKVEPEDEADYVNEPYIENCEPDPNELIDFEDVIRADIVMNKNRIDYDNVIQKSEIKFDEIQPVKGKRGRKPKKKEIPKPATKKILNDCLSNTFQVAYNIFVDEEQQIKEESMKAERAENSDSSDDIPLIDTKRLLEAKLKKEQINHTITDTEQVKPDQEDERLCKDNVEKTEAANNGLDASEKSNEEKPEAETEVFANETQSTMEPASAATEPPTQPSTDSSEMPLEPTGELTSNLVIGSVYTANEQEDDDDDVVLLESANEVIVLDD